jgi:hypothetical protein
MRRLLAQDRAQNIRNPTLGVLPPTLTMAGMMVANTVLNHLVGGTQFIGEKHKLTVLHMCTLYFYA